jgi:long-subunit acyl-CoA synthetase (AMP-forming)
LLFLAVVGAGGIFIGSNPHYTALELAQLFTTCDVCFVIAETEYMNNVQTAANTVELSTERIFVLDQSVASLPIVSRSWVELLQSGEEDWIRFDDERKAKETVACLMSTSGTTGTPKAAEFSHYAQLAACIALSNVSKTAEVGKRD